MVPTCRHLDWTELPRTAIVLIDRGPFSLDVQTVILYFSPPYSPDHAVLRNHRTALSERCRPASNALLTIALSDVSIRSRCTLRSSLSLTASTPARQRRQSPFDLNNRQISDECPFSRAPSLYSLYSLSLLAVDLLQNRL